MADQKQGDSSRGASDYIGHEAYAYRLRRMRDQSLKPPIKAAAGAEGEPRAEAVLECGWGRLVFGQTFTDPNRLLATLQEELPDRRDIAAYIRDPHVLLATAPQDVFLDPSHTYRLSLSTYRTGRQQRRGFFIRRLTARSDADAINRIYAMRGMVSVPPEFFWTQRDARTITYFVAEDEPTGDILGTVTGIDHWRAFGDPERGASMWCLAVDPQARPPGVGEALVRHLAEYFAARGATQLDLSVMHDNSQAIALYEKLGFRRIPFFTVKRKNPINETLFTGPKIGGSLNPYAAIIAREARRRGINVSIVDAEGGFLRLSFGGRSILCRESLSELTSAVAMSLCDDKAVTRRVVGKSGVRVPAQISADAGQADVEAFLQEHGKVVVKPARGEQGRGVALGISSQPELDKAIERARAISDAVLVEEQVKGEDLRLVVIDYRVVAAAVRRPACVVGDGRSKIAELIERQSRRRSAATGGESRIPLDDETKGTLESGGYDLESVLPEGEELEVRRTANLHTGGTIHDVTDHVHPTLVGAAVKVARVVNAPVVGVDLMVESHRAPDYHFIEANERPGLANHEPQPTAARFIDLLFPLSVPVRDAAGVEGELRPVG